LFERHHILTADAKRISNRIELGRQMPQIPQISQISKPEVVVAIPCFNTERFVGDVVSRARKYVDQVIVIDDGSQDNTAVAAKTAGALVINHRVNRGYGEAVKSCFEAAKANAADVLVILDGDGQHNPDNLPQILAPILNGEADLVIGSRFLQPSQPKESASLEPGVVRPPSLTSDSRLTTMPRYRRLGVSVITFLYNLGSKTKVSDTQSGFRAYTRKAYQDFSLTEKGMGVSIETLEKARRKGISIKEVPVSCLYVPSTLKLKAIRHGLGVALAVVRIRFKGILHSLVRGNYA